MLIYLKKLILLMLIPGLAISNLMANIEPVITPKPVYHREVTTLKHWVKQFGNGGIYMIVLPAINSFRTTGGLGRQATVTTGYSGLVMGGVAVSGGVQLNTVYELNSINDATALLITPAYDTTNVTLVYYHISEFFRMAPSGRLYLLLVSQATTLTAICDNTSTNGAYQLLTSTVPAGQIRQIGVCLNPASGYTPTIANGMNTDVIAVSGGVYTGAAVKAQATADIMFGKHTPVRFFVEARNFGGSSSALLDATESACNDVQLVILNDNDVAQANALYHGHAAVGTLLGLRASLQIQQSMAYVSVGNLQSTSTGSFANPNGSFVNPGLSNGALLSTFTTGYTVNGTHTNGDDDIILSKGFIGPRLIAGTPGVYITNDVTATAASDDYYVGPNGLVVNEANRIMYTVMAPNLNQDVNVNPTTGYIDANVITNWTAQLNQAGVAGLSSAVSTASGQPGIQYLIDPNQNVLSTSIINIQIQITPKGYASTINEYIGLNNPYNNG